MRTKREMIMMRTNGAAKDDLGKLRVIRLKNMRIALFTKRRLIFSQSQ